MNNTYKINNIRSPVYNSQSLQSLPSSNSGYNLSGWNETNYYLNSTNDVNANIINVNIPDSTTPQTYNFYFPDIGFVTGFVDPQFPFIRAYITNVNNGFYFPPYYNCMFLFKVGQNCTLNVWCPTGVRDPTKDPNTEVNQRYSYGTTPHSVFQHSPCGYWFGIPVSGLQTNLRTSQYGNLYH